MLVLARRQDQVIRIGPDIRVAVVRISRDEVRLGIQAPPDTLVLREEVPDRGLGTRLLHAKEPR